MLLMINLDSAVWYCGGGVDRSGVHSSRWTMLKICVALNKEKGFRSSDIRFRLNHQVNRTKLHFDETTTIECIVPDNIRLFQDSVKAQNLHRIKQRKWELNIFLFPPNYHSTTTRCGYKKYKP